MQQQISNQQLDTVKSAISQHREKSKFFDQLRQAVAKDPRLATIDKNQILEKIKSEGILTDIIKSLPIQMQKTGNASATPVDIQAQKQHQQEAKRLDAKTPSSLQAKLAHSTRQYNLEPNKRYLAVRLVHLKALVDFVNPREDEYIYATVSFLKQRFSTGA